MVTQTWVNIGLGNRLLPDGNNPLPESIDLSLMRFGDFHLRAISGEMIKIYILQMSLKMTNLNLELHLPGANESMLAWWLGQVTH